MSGALTITNIWACSMRWASSMPGVIGPIIGRRPGTAPIPCCRRPAGKNGGNGRIEALDCDVFRHGSGLPGGALDRAHNALISSAAADIRVHVLDDLVARRFRIVLEQIGGAHDLAGLTVTALWHLLGEPRLCSGCDESAESPSIVVTTLPATSDIWV
jgi:hypothetical protein